MKNLLLALLLIVPLQATALDSTQIQTLHNAIVAEPTLTTCLTAGDDGCVFNWLNGTSTFVVWRTSVSRDEYQTVTSAAATTFNWSGAGGYIARSQGERDAWNTMFGTSNASVDPSKANVRLAFADIFSGAGVGAVNNRTHLDAISKRFATNAEKVLATGIGTSGSPGNLTFVGNVPFSDVVLIVGR